MATTPKKKQAPAKELPAKKVTVPPTASTAKSDARGAPAKTADLATAPAAKAAAPKAAKAKAAAPKAAKATAKKAAAPKAAPAKVSPKKKLVDGVMASANYDATFLKVQRDALLAEKAQLLGQAQRLEDEAAALMADQETGDVQFDDESGEGDTIAVERERDLALSAQARQLVAEIEAALERIKDGTYGYSVVSGKPIPKERLRAIPWATELVEEKVGGLGGRR